MVATLKEMLSDSNVHEGSRAITYVETVIDYENDLAASNKNAVFVSS